MNIAELRALVGADHGEAFGRRLELAREGVSPELRAATACLTLLAGAGTRLRAGMELQAVAATGR